MTSSRVRVLRGLVLAGACLALLGASITTAAPASALTRAHTVRSWDYPHETARQSPSSTLLDAAGRVVTAGAWVDYTRAWTTSCTSTASTAGPAPTEAALSRYQLDGSMDPTFGTEGVVRIDLSPLGLDYDDSALTSLAIDDQGRFLAVLTTTQRFCGVPAGTPDTLQERRTIRLLADGRIDTSFGDAGALSPAVTPHAQRDGGVLGTLDATGLYSFTETGVTRLDTGSPVSCPDPVRAGTAIACRWSGLTGGGSSAGSLTLLDEMNDFAPEPGTDALGAFPLPLPGSPTAVRDVRIRQVRWDGERLLALASVTRDPTPGFTFPYDRLYALRKDPVSGWVLDPAYGSGGFVHLATPATFRGADVDVDSHGSAVVLWRGALADGHAGFRLTRVTPGGAPDATFGTSGASTLPCGWSRTDDECLSPLAVTIDEADRTYVTAPAKRESTTYGLTPRPPAIDDPVRRYTPSGLLEAAWRGNPRPSTLDVWWGFLPSTRVTSTSVPVTVSWSTRVADVSEPQAGESLCTQTVNGQPTLVGTRSRVIPARPGRSLSIAVAGAECHTRYPLARTSTSTPTIVNPKPTSSWVNVRVPGSVQGYELRTRKKLVGVAVRVTGSHIALVASMGPGRGRMSIVLNGRYYATVDLRAPRVTAPMVVWQRQVLDRTHTLKVVNLGTPGRPLGVVDAILVHS